MKVLLGHITVSIIHSKEMTLMCWAFQTELLVPCAATLWCSMAIAYVSAYVADTMLCSQLTCTNALVCTSLFCSNYNTVFLFTHILLSPRFPFQFLLFSLILKMTCPMSTLQLVMHNRNWLLSLFKMTFQTVYLSVITLTLPHQLPHSTLQTQLRLSIS